MRVLVIGAGALGGYYGACVVRAGGDVTFLVRAKRAEQLRRDGLRVVSPHGDFAVQPKILLANELKAPFDVVLVGVKAYSLDDAMSQFAPAVGASTMILPILNGLKHIDALTARFGAGLRPRRAGECQRRARCGWSCRSVHGQPDHRLRRDQGFVERACACAGETAPGPRHRRARQRRDHAGHVGEIRPAQHARRHHLPDARQHRRHPDRAEGRGTDLPPVRRTLRRRNSVRLRAAGAVHRVRPKTIHDRRTRR